MRRSPNYDAVCFLAQQCAEKYLKALLQEAGVPFGKTHNLTVLLELLLKKDPSWENLRAPLRALTGFAVSVRYPGEQADKATAREALASGQAVRSEARSKLALRK